MRVDEKTIFIETSPEEIWEMLPADRISKWQPYMAKNKRKEYITEVKTQEDKYKPGTVMHFDGTCQFEVLESKEKEKLVYHISENSFLGKLGGRLIYSIEPLDSGCRFIYRSEMEFPNPIARILITNYFTIRWYDKQIRSYLENLKSILERTQ